MLDNFICGWKNYSELLDDYSYVKRNRYMQEMEAIKSEIPFKVNHVLDYWKDYLKGEKYDLIISDDGTIQCPADLKADIEWNNDLQKALAGDREEVIR